jgi:anti-sigma factor RsiW
MSAGRGVPHNDALLDELVAYLDGELDRDANRDVERRLSQDAAYRDRLRRLQQTWDLLDHLPQADVDESFTQSTIAMVAVRAATEHRDVASRGRRQRHLWFAGIALGTALTFAFGFAATRWVAGSADRQLVRDLPVIENVDLYRYAESIEFLRMLEREGLFADGEDDDL